MLRMPRISHNVKNMSVLIEDKTVSGTGSFVVSYFAFYFYISRFGFISILAFILLPGTYRITEKQT